MIPTWAAAQLQNRRFLMSQSSISPGNVSDGEDTLLFKHIPALSQSSFSPGNDSYTFELAKQILPDVCRNPVLALAMIPTDEEIVSWMKQQLCRNPVLALAMIPTMARVQCPCLYTLSRNPVLALAMIPTRSGLRPDRYPNQESQSSISPGNVSDVVELVTEKIC